MEDVEEEVAVPRDEKEQQQVIESNEEVKKEDEMIRANIQIQEKTIVSLEDDLKDKEKVLYAIKEQQKILQSNLLEVMKNEYHKKIAEFQIEMQQLEQERSEQLRRAGDATQKSKLEEVYKKKLKDLEDKLGQAKAKEREQTTMQQQSSTHK